MDSEKSGRIISNARKKLNMTQKELAEKICVSDKAVSKWERGLSFPDVAILIPLSEVLNINLYDLIKGEESKKKQDDEVLKETIKLSTEEIVKSKKKIALICSIITIIICIAVLFSMSLIKGKNEEQMTDYVMKGEKFTEKNWSGSYRIATKEHDDGWFCRFMISYPPEVSKYDKKNYSYNCFNLKYKELKGFNYYNYNDRLNKYYISDENYPSYVHNINYLNDVKKIEEFFYKKQFNKKIVINDLSDLNIEYINKNDVLELFNKTVKSTLIDSYGNYPMHLATIYSYEYSSFETGETYVTGYHLDSSGHIRDFYIDIKYGSEYLSDRIKYLKEKSNLSNEDRFIYESSVKQYNKLQQIKKHILEEQDFSIPKELKNDIDAIEIEKNNFYVIKLLTEKNYGHFGNIIRYVEDENEMNSQIKENIDY